ncbi:MAG TPA: type II protein secretion system D protein, partial [Nautiliaceae bacterium]|nr:type II protein secretion system D protein [Nautiliaceae bacterium]
MNCLIIKKGLAIKKFFIIFMFFVVVYANNCNKRLFSLHIVEPINLKFLLIDLVNECQLNIILKDKKAKEIIHQDIEFINVENVSLKKFLDVLFTQADLFYELKGNNLIISYYKTQTFELNFIPNSISGTTGISNNIDKNVNTLTTKYNFNFWDNLKNSIIQLLKNSDEVYKNPIIDKNSGLITVTGTKNQIEEIKRYIDNLNNSLHKEVLIDVKIYTVELSKSHQTGIKWS